MKKRLMSRRPFANMQAVEKALINYFQFYRSEGLLFQLTALRIWKDSNERGLSLTRCDR